MKILVNLKIELNFLSSQDFKVVEILLRLISNWKPRSMVGKIFNQIEQNSFGLYVRML